MSSGALMREAVASGEAETRVLRYRRLFLKVVSCLVVGVTAILARECAREIGSDLVESRNWSSEVLPSSERSAWTERVLMNDTAKAELPCELVPTNVGDVPAGMSFFPSSCRDSDLLLSAALIQADTYDLEKGTLGVLQNMRAEATRSGAVNFTVEQSATSISGLPARHARGSFRVGEQVARFESLVISDGKSGWIIQAIFPDSANRQGDVKRIFTSLRLESGTAPNPEHAGDGYRRP